MVLFWHRRDLRVADNVGLAAAAEHGPVTPVFVLDRDVLAHASPPRVAFMLDALASLREAYRNRGGDLLVRRGDPRAVLPDLAEERDAARVVWNRDYSGLARERDADVEEALADAGIEATSFQDELLFEPGSITTNEGDVYSVYSYFRDKWQDRATDEPVDPPAGEDVASADGDPLPTVDDLGFEEPGAEVPPAGPQVARDRLTTFCDGAIYEYEDRRDYPAAGCTSRLSPHLKFGTIGIRAVYAATDEAMESADGDDARASVKEFRSQLAWREFYAHLLWDRPETVTTNVRDFENDVEWRDDPDELRAWKAGETGYPIVDAGMRQLREEAWMHNRVRMIVASFLTKDLLIDWRAGYDHFREHLVDHDTANDVGGWQWAASTGADAQPYFRIFNPVTQGERYDPEAEYVWAYVPELREATAAEIHRWAESSPPKRDEVAPEYPAPIVDHAERRERAIEVFEAARGKE